MIGNEDEIKSLFETDDLMWPLSKPPKFVFGHLYAGKRRFHYLRQRTDHAVTLLFPSMRRGRGSVCGKVYFRARQ